MPLTLIVTRDVPGRYRGFLASVMPEVAPGVYVAPDLSKGVRERVWAVLADGWLYPAALGYAERDLALDLTLLAATRAQMAADLDRLPADAWARTGIHTETGLVTLRQMLLHAIRHAEHHIRTIEEKRAALGV